MRDDGLALLTCPWTGGPLEVEAASATRGRHAGADEVTSGVLRSEAGEFPIVDGIPVLLPGHDRAVALVRAGRPDEALAVAVLAGLPRSRREDVLAALAGAPGVGRATAVVARHNDQRAVDRAIVALAPDGPSDGPVRLMYLDSPGRSVDAYNYFAQRWSTPRHLVGLACIEAVPPDGGPVLDLGCGAGHLTWALARRVAPRPVVGVDRSLPLLVVARRHHARSAHLVCADATALPFPAATFSAVLSSDVLSFVTAKWSVARELDRVLDDAGWLALSSVKHAGRDHVYAGEPLTPRGWARLVGHLHHRVLDDDAVLADYLAGNGIRAATQPDLDGLRGRTLTVLASRRGDVAVDHGRFPSWPHARGGLALNPLYEPTGPRDRTAGGVRYRRRFPTETYAADNPQMVDYLPEEVVVPDGVVDRAADDAAQAELVASLVLLALPATEAYAPAATPGL